MYELAKMAHAGYEIPNGHTDIDSGPMLAMKPNGHCSEGHFLPPETPNNGPKLVRYARWPRSTHN